MSDVYGPGEDSLFLSKVIAVVHSERVAEVGVGSGFVIDEYVRTNAPRMAVGTDVDIGAIEVARRRDSHDSIEYVLCRSCDVFREDAFQFIFFNPPYLKDEGVYDVTTSGGAGGVERTYEMVCSSYRALTSRGCMIFLASSLSDIETLLQRLLEQEMRPRKLTSSKLFFEELYAFKVTKENVSRRFR